MAEWVIRLIEQTGYLGVAFLMLAETVFPPIPSEVIMSVAGLEAARGGLSLPLVILSGAAGAMFGNLFWYFLARALGLERFHPFINRWGRWLTIDWHEVERADKWFRRHGNAFVGIGRIVPTIRSLVSVPAGFLHMSLKSFTLWSSIGTTAWTAMLALVGWTMGKQYGRVDAILGPVGNAVIGLLLFFYLWRVVTWKPKTVSKAHDRKVRHVHHTPNDDYLPR